MDDLLNQVIDKTAIIENMMDNIIHSYCGPRQEAFEFFRYFILDSSVMTLGAKIKLVIAISHRLELGLNSDSLYKVVALRNAFAHHSTTSHPTIKVGKNPQNDSINYYLQVITQSGKLKRKSREQAIEQFHLSYGEAKTALKRIISKIEQL